MERAEAVRHLRAWLAAAVVLSVSAPTAARAYRPFDSTDAAVAAKGELEIELGPVGFLKQGMDRALVAPSLVLNWGLAERWELVLQGSNFVELGSEIAGPRIHVEETGLFLKTVLRDGSLQERAGPSIATEFGALLPTINGEPGVGAQGTVIASQRWTDLTVHLDGEVAWTRAHRPAFFGGTIFEVHDAWAVRPVAELFVQVERDVPTIVSGLIGAIWRVQENLSFDAGARIARASAVNTAEIRAGLTWAFSVGVPR